MTLSSTSIQTDRDENQLTSGSGEVCVTSSFLDDSSRLSDGKSRANGQRYLASSLDLPTDKPRPAVLGSAMGIEETVLSIGLSSQLYQLSRSAEIQVTTAGLALFSLLLHRYSGQEKFVVAFSVEHEMLPIPVDFSDRPTFHQLAQRFEADLTAASKAALPANLAELHSLERDSSRHPVFQCAFVAGTGNEKVAADLDLYLEFQPGNHIVLKLHYNEDLFERGTARRMLAHMQRMAEAAVENMDRAAVTMPMLTQGERGHVLRDNSARDEHAGKCLHQLFEMSAASFPNELAAVYEQDQLTYAELDARANQLANLLRKRGVGRNARVGICLQRSLDFAVAILATLKAGGTCVPLDPKYPSERLTYMLGDVASQIVITERGLLQAEIPAGTQVLYFSEERQTISSQSDTNAGSDATAEDIAYIIYTSGSTGRPRGVLLHHAGLANYAAAGAKLFDLRPGDRVLQFCSISFDAALEEIYATWAAGATLVFRNDEISLEPGEFLGAVAKQGITVMDLPTAYWHEWVYALPALSQKVPPSLRLVIVGGEKASPEAFATWHKVVGNRVRLVNTYGPAEASIVATAYEPKLQPGEEAPAVLPIGRPVANARVYLLDSHLNLVPLGVPGELHIGGIGVARGYLNLPQLTQEKFIADIFSDIPSARMYKTGDLAKYLPNGEIEFVGRRDNQVKIRGFRVEPGEIESILSKHSGVQENAVGVREDVHGDKRLVAYIVRAGQGSVSEGELRKYLQKHLPEYMVPAEFAFVQSMPLTPNGKVDRRSLTSLKIDSEQSTKETQGSDALQAQLTKIWEDLLRRKSISPTDNFFELGGHSLLAARMMLRVRQVLGKSIPLAVLLKAPTIEKLSSVLREGWERDWSSLVAVQPEGTKAPFFMVHGVGGNVVGFHELGQHMQPDYPFYGLQSQGLNGKESCHTTIEEMAAHYLREMRTVQSHGPYHIGGFSMGGLVAYEIARQLRQSGEDVALLVLFDTYAAKPKSAKKSLLNMLLHPKWEQIKRLPTAVRKNIRWKIRAARLPEDLKKVLSSNAQAADRYQLRAYDGEAVLLRAGNKLRNFDDAYSKWGELISSLKVIEIPGAHMDILREPHVSRLAQQLKTCIDGSSAQSFSDFFAETAAESQYVPVTENASAAN